MIAYILTHENINNRTNSEADEHEAHLRGVHEAVHQCEHTVATHEVAREQLEGLQVPGVHKSVHQQECAPRERRLETDMQGSLCFIGLVCTAMAAHHSVHSICCELVLQGLLHMNWCAQ